MKQLNMKHVVMTSFLTTTLLASMFCGMKVNATQAVEPGDNSTTATRPIGCIYDHTNDYKLSGVVLNGNSVVIKAAEEKGYFNIYVDTNRNGLVDADENAFEYAIIGPEQEKSANIPNGVSLYGVYDSTVTNPFTITVESGVFGDIYGVYKGTVDTDADVAVKIDIKGGTCQGDLYGAYQSNVTAGKVAIDIDVTGDAAVKHYFIGAEGLKGDNPEQIYKITGDVDVDWNTDALADDADKLINFVGLKNNINVEGSVDLYLNNLNTETIVGLDGNVVVTGNYTQKSELTTRITHGNHGMLKSTVTGDAHITIHGAQSEDERPTHVYAVKGYCNRANKVAVGGKTTLIYSGGCVGNLYATQKGDSQNSPVFNGDVEVDVQSGSADFVQLIDGTVINGSLAIDVREGCQIKGRCYCVWGGRMEKDVTINIHNIYENTEIAGDDFSALRDPNVAGNVTIVVDGGNYDELRAIYGSESGYSSQYIGGELDLTVKNVDARLMRMLYYGNMAYDDAKITVDNVTTGEFVGLLDSRVIRGLEMTIKDSTFGYDSITDAYSSNNSYLFGRTLLVNGAKVEMINTTFANRCGFGFAFGTQDGSKLPDVTCRNVQFENANYGVSTSPEASYKICVDAKVGVTSTKEKPLATVTGLGKTVSCLENAEVRLVDDLPEGLVLEDGKIYGTPTKAYPDGITVNCVVVDDNNRIDMPIHFVVAKKDCEFDSNWTSDDKHHWHACTDEGCDEVKDKAEHTWDDGVVTKEATATEKGVKTYTCTACKATKTEEVPVITENNENTPGDEAGDTPEAGGEATSDPEVATPSAKGTVLKDADKKGDYTVTNADPASPEVSYKVTSKTAKEIVIPKTVTVDGVEYKVTSIKSGTFKNHKNLKKVTIGANVKTISKNAFSGCKKLTTVKMGGNVTTIGANAFYNCTALKSITIPKNVKEIGAKAFYNCKKLTKITINTTKLTKSKVGKKAFTKAGSNNYKKLTVKVPKKKKNAYKTMLKSRGLSSKAKVK